MAIIAVLMGVSLVAYQGTRKAARDSKRKADLEQIRSALEIYRTDQRTYYPSNSFPFDQKFFVGNDVYMEKVPTDPLSPTYKYHYVFDSPNKYYLCAYLETGSAQSTNCGSCDGASCNYEVTNP
jgi:general secretion pathway protein G